MHIPEFHDITELESQYKANREALFVHDFNCGKILHVNEAMLNMYGYTREEALNINPENITGGDAPHTVEKAFELFKKVKEAGEISFEWHDQRKNGQLFWTDNIMRIVKIGGQKSIVVLSRDVTVRKKKHLKLQTTVRENTQEILELNEKLTLANEELKIINEELENYKVQLEDLVAIRTQELKKSEEKLSLTEIRYSNFIEQSIEGVSYFRPGDPIDTTLSPLSQARKLLAKCILIECNDAYSRMYGFASEKFMVNKTMIEILGDTLEDDWLKLLTEFVRSAYSLTNYQTSEISEDGTMMYFLNNLIGIVQDKKLIGVWNSRCNITELKKAELVIRQSEERFRSIIQYLTDVILILDANLNIIYESPSGSEVMGFPPGSLVGMSALQLIHPNDLDAILQDMQEVFAKQNDFRPTEFRAKHRSGHWMIFEAIANNMLDHPAIQGIIITCRDISERKNAERALGISESKFRNIFNNSSDAIIMVGNNYTILEANDVFLKLSGYTLQETKTMKMTDMITDIYLPDFVDKLLRLFQHENLPAVECEIRSKSKLSTPVEINSKLIEFEGEKALVSIIRDITERRQFENRILDTIISTEEKEREKFARNLHDELGPLLSSIKMYVNSLSSVKDKTKHDFIISQLKQILTEAIQSTKELSNDLSPHILLNYGLIAALDWFNNQIKPYISITLESNLKENRYGTSLELAIYRIIKELINNTVKHAKASSIKIKLHIILGTIRLVYSDNGSGFPVNWQDNFEFLGMGMSNIMSRSRSLNAVSKFYNHAPNGMSFEMEVPVG